MASLAREGLLSASQVTTTSLDVPTSLARACLISLVEAPTPLAAVPTLLVPAQARLAATLHLRRDWQSTTALPQLRGEEILLLLLCPSSLLLLVLDLLVLAPVLPSLALQSLVLPNMVLLAAARLRVVLLSLDPPSLDLPSLVLLALAPQNLVLLRAAHLKVVLPALELQTTDLLRPALLVLALPSLVLQVVAAQAVFPSLSPLALRLLLPSPCLQAVVLPVVRLPTLPEASPCPPAVSQAALQVVVLPVVDSLVPLAVVLLAAVPPATQVKAKTTTAANLRAEAVSGTGSVAFLAAVRVRVKVRALVRARVPARARAMVPARARALASTAPKSWLRCLFSSPLTR